MKELTAEQRSNVLHGTVADSRRELDAALAALEGAVLERVSLGRQVAEHPWRWLFGACAIGLFLGARR